MFWLVSQLTPRVPSNRSPVHRHQNRFCVAEMKNANHYPILRMISVCPSLRSFSTLHGTGRQGRYDVSLMKSYCGCVVILVTCRYTVAYLRHARQSILGYFLVKKCKEAGIAMAFEPLTSG
jgi:hypothetical protein